MSDTPATTKQLRILLACARPMALRTLKVDVRLHTADNGPAADALASLLRDRLKLTILEKSAEGDRILFHLSAPLPDRAYLESEIRKSTDVIDVTFTENGSPIDLLRPDEEREALLKGLHALDRSVAVDILDHAKPQDLCKHLDAESGYDVLYLVCHGDASGNFLLEDGRGWARFVGARELAEIVGGSVKILILGACHGERGLAGLVAAPETQRPPVIIYSQGEYPIPCRAVHLFTEGFFRRLAEGKATTDAFRKGVECVRCDDDIGEVRCPDGMLNEGPSPHKRLKMNEIRPESFPAIARGGVDPRDLQPPAPPHRKTTRTDDLLLGRQIEIARLMGELLPPGSGLREEKSRLIHLHGEGGIGKTRLAQAVCNALADYRHFPAGIYEMACEDIPDARQLAVSLLKTLGLAEAEKIPDPIAGLLAILKEASTSAGDLLVMLDNVDPLFIEAHKEETARLLKQVLSECPLVRILSTCRSPLHLGGYESDFLVDPLPFPDAVSLFFLCIPDADIRGQVQSLPPDQQKHMEKLIIALQGHPLSIFLAAHRIARGPDPIVQQLIQAEKKIMELLDAGELVGVPIRQRSLRASLDLSSGLLSDRGREIFRKGSQFPAGLYRHASILDSLLGQNWRDAAQEIADIGLIRFERDAQRYWMLNPVREYAEDLLEKEGSPFKREVAGHWARFTAFQDFLLNPSQAPEDYARLNLPSDARERQEELARLHDNACAALRAEEANILFSFRWALQNDGVTAEQIATRMMGYLKIDGKRQTNAWMAFTTLEACTAPDLRAKWLNNLGIRFSELGNREGALKATQEALEIYRTLAKKHPEAFLPDVAMTLNNLGNRLSELGDREGALKAAQEALEIRRTLAKKHPEAFLPDVAMTLNNLGTMLSELGDREGALKAAQEALEIRRTLAKKHPEAFLPYVAGTLNNLGTMLSELGDREGALKAAQEALEIRRTLAKKHPEAFLPYVAGTLNNLGTMLSELGDREGALKAAQEALEIYRTLAKKHPEAFLPDVAMTLNNLGTMLSELGDREGALKAAQEALEIRRTLAKKHPEAFLPDVAMTLNNLGTMLSELGDREGALKAAQEALEIRRTLAKKHPEAFLPDVAMTLNNLGTMLSELGDREGALKAAQEALEIYRKLAEKHPEASLPDVAMTLHNLGNRLSELGDREGALKAAQEALEIRRTLAKKHPEAFLPYVAGTLNNLGTMLSELGDREGALKAAQEALEIRRTLAKKHPEAFLPYVAGTLNNLGTMLSELGDREGALKAAQEALEIYRTLAKKHPEAFLPDVAMTLNNLGNRLSELGDREGALKAAQEALEIYRTLAKKHPEAFLPDVAMTLNNLGIMLSELGDREGALKAAQEALDIRRKLAHSKGQSGTGP